MKIGCGNRNECTLAFLSYSVLMHCARLLPGAVDRDEWDSVGLGYSKRLGSIRCGGLQQTQVRREHEASLEVPEGFLEELSSELNLEAKMN